MDFQLVLAGVGIGSLVLIAVGYGWYRLGRRKGAAERQPECDKLQESLDLEVSKYKQLSESWAVASGKISELDLKLEEADSQIETLRGDNAELVKAERCWRGKYEELAKKTEGAPVATKKRSAKKTA